MRPDSFPSYHGFSNTTMLELYGDEKLKASTHLKATTFSSMYLENTGGKLKPKPLPPEAQLFPINAMSIMDFNEDGNLDMVLAGNVFSTEVETPRYDAGMGLFMLGDGNGGFASYNSIGETGMLLRLDVKDMDYLELTRNRIKSLVVSNNKGPLQFIGYRK